MHVLGSIESHPRLSSTSSSHPASCLAYQVLFRSKPIAPRRVKKETRATKFRASSKGKEDRKSILLRVPFRCLLPKHLSRDRTWSHPSKLFASLLRDSSHPPDVSLASFPCVLPWPWAYVVLRNVSLSSSWLPSLEIPSIHASMRNSIRISFPKDVAP